MHRTNVTTLALQGVICRDMACTAAVLRLKMLLCLHPECAHWIMFLHSS
jgi:hypothetical protein